MIGFPSTWLGAIMIDGGFGSRQCPTISSVFTVIPLNYFEYQALQVWLEHFSKNGCHHFFLELFPSVFFIFTSVCSMSASYNCTFVHFIISDLTIFNQSHSTKCLFVSIAWTHISSSSHSSHTHAFSATSPL